MPGATGTGGGESVDVGEALQSAEPVSFNEIPTMLMGKLTSWGETAVTMLPNLVAALLIFSLFWFLAKGVARGARRALDRLSDHSQVNWLLQIAVRTAITAGGLFIALGVMNLDKVVTSLLAGVGVVGLALGFAFQDIASNFMSGTIMSVVRPFKVGDLIETNDYFGRVEHMDLRVTHLRTATGELVLIPNKEVYNNSMVNYTESPERRVDLSVGVGYGDDLDAVEPAVVEALAGLACCNTDKPVEVYFEEFGGSSINFVARFWIDSGEQSEYAKARHAAMIAVKKALDAAGLNIPFPIRTLDFGANAVGGQQLDGMLRPQLFHDPQDEASGEKQPVAR